MINHSALSNTLSVAELVPKAAPMQPSRGDGAFGEALAGAHSVHDRRESREATTPTRREGPTTTERPDEARTDRTRTDRADSTERERPVADGDSDVRADDGARSSEDSDAGSSTDAGSTQPTNETGTSTQTGSDTDTSDAANAGDAAAQAAADAAATVAVAAAPVASTLDAIMVPTTAVAATTDAVDAAIKLAIGDAAAKIDAAFDANATPGVDVDVTASATGMSIDVDVNVDIDIDAKLAAAIARGAEDAVDGDVQAGPTSPSTSTSTTTSGPSPVQLAAATFDEAADDAVNAASTKQAATAALAASTDVAEGNAPDANAQLVQAAALDGDGEFDTTLDAAVTATAAKSGPKDASAASAAASDIVDVVEADVPEAVQAARLNQQQAPTVAAAAQQQAALQAKAAEQAAEDGVEAPVAKVEGLPAQAAVNTGRNDQVPPGIRVREGLLVAHQQQRIDHIADQLATRLRLSQAAGGSQVQLSLKPRELGDVSVQMQVRDGVVAATIIVEKADTARTMQANIEDLKRSLESQGLSIQEFSVDVRGEAGAGGANARAAADLRGNATRTSSGSAGSIAGAAAVLPGFSGDDQVVPEDVHDGDVSVLA